MKATIYGATEPESPEDCIRTEFFRDDEFVFGLDIKESEAALVESPDELQEALEEAAVAAGNLSFEDGETP